MNKHLLRRIFFFLAVICVMIANSTTQKPLSLTSQASGFPLPLGFLSYFLSYWTMAAMTILYMALDMSKMKHGLIWGVLSNELRQVIKNLLAIAVVVQLASYFLLIPTADNRSGWTIGGIIIMVLFFLSNSLRRQNIGGGPRRTGGGNRQQFHGGANHGKHGRR